jgi:predicted nuclease with RNAse H fold
MNYFLGFDLTSAAKRPTAFAVFDQKRHLREAGFLKEDNDLLEKALQWSPSWVGIDAPLGLPRGLCCLEESCSCRPASALKGRACERALARRGISLYFTTKKSIIKGMVYRAVALRAKLEQQGHRVLETYPYGTRVLLFGPTESAKTTSAGLTAIAEHLASVVPNLESFRAKLTHDLADAILAAYTTYLSFTGQAEGLGDVDEGQIVVPLRPGAAGAKGRTLTA